VPPFTFSKLLEKKVFKPERVVYKEPEEVQEPEIKRSLKSLMTR
jgi:hypothetical protein